MTMISRKLIRRHPDGYEIWREISRPTFEAFVINDAGDPRGTQEIADAIDDASDRLVTLEVAYTPDGHYIGNLETADRLCRQLDITPELAGPEDNVCSIGWSVAEQKWYGWSHRAIHGFEVGSQVKRGDCAYEPEDKEEFRLNCIRFWDDASHDQTVAHETTRDGQLGVYTEWRYADSVPNKELHGRISGVFTPYPEEFGRGEWAAETLEDAKRAAIAFAASVS